MGNMVQSNSIGDAFHNAFGMSHLAVGIVVAVIAAFIFLGGVQRIAAVTEKIVPIMAAFYIVGCVVILVMNYKTLPNAFTQIFVLAFNPQAMAGGVAGVTAWARPRTPTRWLRSTTRVSRAPWPSWACSSTPLWC